MSNDSKTPPPGGQFLVYQTQDGKLKIDAYEERALERMAAVKESLTAADDAATIGT